MGTHPLVDGRPLAACGLTPLLRLHAAHILAVYTNLEISQAQAVLVELVKRPLGGHRVSKMLLWLQTTAGAPRLGGCCSLQARVKALIGAGNRISLRSLCVPWACRSWPCDARATRPSGLFDWAGGCWAQQGWESNCSVLDV